MTVKTVPEASWQVGLGDLRFLVIDEIRRLLVEEKQAAERASSAGFIAREKAQLIRRLSIDDAMAELARLADAVSEAFQNLEKTADKAKTFAGGVRQAANGVEMEKLIKAIIIFFGQPMPAADQPVPAADQPAVTITGNANGVVFSIGSAPKLQSESNQGEFTTALASASHAQTFLAAVSEMINRSRCARRKLSGIEQFVRAAAYQALETGTSLPPAFRGIGVSGFRLYQTNLSLADPGEGHNLVTCLDKRLLEGTIVHVEHIDRGKVTDREIVEAYRLPAPLNAARVRLQVGTAAPCTAYIGRTPFENGARPDAATYVPMASVFEEDLLKAAHMTASACSVMFANGIADCKIAMERMKATELICFMEAIAGNVFRDRSRQFLSAAFNLNVPLFDDRAAGSPRWVGDKFEIAQLAIELAAAGGFEKVTWDGASNLATSKPIILSFTDAQWLELIHQAHERGLETYVSAGMDKQHMPTCVYSGVDGVGIGTSLHYRKPENGKYIMGELKPDAILEVLKKRNEAAKSARGRGAGALAILDRLYFEQILLDKCNKCNELRIQLFGALSAASSCNEDIKAKAIQNIEAILDELGRLKFWVWMIKHKEDSYNLHPVIAQAQRRLNAPSQPEQKKGTSLVKAPAQSNVLMKSETQKQLQNAVEREDITDLMEILRLKI